ncbi:MAG: ABC transporter permease [Burkholderiales bacterium]
MRLQNVRAMARKEWWHLLRDARSLVQMFLMPTMMLFLYGYAINLDIMHAPIGILQESHDSASNDMAAHFEASRAFHVVLHFPDRHALSAAIQAGDVWAALVIPHDFAAGLARGQGRVQLILDGSDANTGRLVRNYALALVNGYALSLQGVASPITVEDRTWFNEANESRYAIVPGVIVMVMSVVGALMTSLTVAREMESGNLVMLRTTPLTRGEFLLGKLVPYFFVGMADVLAAVAAAVFIFDIPLRGSVVSLALVSALFLLVVMTQGVLISLIAGNQILASQMVQVTTFLPSFMLSGIIYAIANMPQAIQYLSLIVPARYYVALSKAIFLKGIGPLVLWGEVLALFAVLTVLGVLLARKSRELGLQ